MTDLPTLAASLSEAQRRAVLWCDPTGPKPHIKGSPPAVSFWVLQNFVKGNPDKEVAQFCHITIQGEGDRKPGTIWPTTTWALTPLGLELRAFLEGEGQ